MFHVKHSDVDSVNRGRVAWRRRFPGGARVTAFIDGLPDFTIGVEEEYLIVDPETRDLVANPPRALLHECEAALPPEVGSVSPELLRSQIEVGTSVCGSIAEVRERLTALRCTVAQTLAAHELRIVAASTHPFALWSRQLPTDKERYQALAEDMQSLAQRLVIGGMHVHVGIPEPQDRIDVLNQITYFLPHLLALSTSSPFWQGRDTGLRSYRRTIMQGLPRTGLPERFASHGEYQRMIQSLLDAGLIDDPTKVWWDARPHARLPTLEMRITDVCTSLDDAICIAALYVCVVSMLARMRRANQRWRIYPLSLLEENCWRAQRYGIDRGLVDFGLGQIKPLDVLLEELLDLIREDAERLDCVAEVEHVRTILARGASAHRQLAVYESQRRAGVSEQHALEAVVDWLIDETMAGAG